MGRQLLACQKLFLVLKNIHSHFTFKNVYLYGGLYVGVGQGARVVATVLLDTALDAQVAQHLLTGPEVPHPEKWQISSGAYIFNNYSMNTVKVPNLEQ